VLEQTNTNQTLLTTTMIELTTIELAEVLLNLDKNPGFVGMTTETVVKMRKTNNPYIGATKVSKQFKLATFFNYEDSVNNRLTKEHKSADFTAKKSWHKQLNASLVTDEKTETKFYFRYRREATSTIESTYQLNGSPISKDLLSPFMPTPSSYDNQGLNNPIRFQVVELSNIKSISFGGNTYQIV